MRYGLKQICIMMCCGWLTTNGTNPYYGNGRDFMKEEKDKQREVYNCILIPLSNSVSYLLTLLNISVIFKIWTESWKRVTDPFLMAKEARYHLIWLSSPPLAFLACCLVNFIPTLSLRLLEAIWTHCWVSSHLLELSFFMFFLLWISWNFHYELRHGKKTVYGNTCMFLCQLN